MTRAEPCWSYEPLRVGGVYGTFGVTQTRVLLRRWGYFDVYTDTFSERSDYLHFSDGFIRQPEPQLPKYELLESVVVDAEAVRRLRAIGDVIDELYDEPPFRTVAGGLTCWRVELRSGHQLFVMAHRHRRRWGRIVFEINTFGGRKPNVLPVVSLTARSARLVEEHPMAASELHAEDVEGDECGGNVGAP